VDSGHGHSAFANRRGTTLDRSGADVASCKDSGETRFERSGAAFVFAPRWSFSDLGTSFNESFFVPLNFRRQPRCAWASANHGKHSRRSNHSALACLGIFQFDLFQLLSAGHFADLRVVEDLDVFAGLHPTRKIVRHLVGNVVSPNDK
jgi:hypothetical protein